MNNDTLLDLLKICIDIQPTDEIWKKREKEVFNAIMTREKAITEQICKDKTKIIIVKNGSKGQSFLEDKIC